MLRQERVEDAAEAMRAMLLGWQSEMWTALPGFIQTVNYDANTCEVQPTIKGIFRQPDGTTKVVTPPLCLDVPILWPGGGGFSFTYPLAESDEGLLVFASRCIDAWWQSGGVQAQSEIRMHDLSDGFFIPGFRSQVNKLASVSQNSARLWKNDGTYYVDIADAQITLKHPTKVVIDAPDAELTGNLKVDGTTHLVGDITADGDIIGGGSQAVKLADGSNSTKLKGT